MLYHQSNHQSNQCRMNQVSKREKIGSPLNFEWDEDMMDPKAKLEVLEHFIDGHEGSLAGDEPLDFSVESKPDGLSKPNPITLDSRKRSQSSTTASSQLSEASGLGSMSRRKKKPRGMPKRPLSAYNLFFQSERTKIQDEAHGAGEKIGFEGLGKIIGKKWQGLGTDERKMHEKMAEKDTVRYRKEMETYNELKTKKREEEEKIARSTPLVETTLEKETAEASVRAYDSGSFLRQPSSAAQSEAFVVAGAPQALPLSSRAEFSRTRAMTAPVASSQYSSAPQHLERLVANIASVYQSHYDGGVQRVGAHQMSSMPPPPQGAERVPIPNSFHMPPGMEIVLGDQLGQDRRYSVQYTCYSMTRDAATKYMESMTTTPSRSHPPPSHQHQQMQVNGGGVSRGPQE
jgi:hypothetical protein